MSLHVFDLERMEYEYIPVGLILGISSVSRWHLFCGLLDESKVLL